MRKPVPLIVLAAALMNEIAYIFLAERNGTLAAGLIDSLAFSLFPWIGAVLIARHGRNPIGYLITVMGLSVVGAGTLYEYASLGLHGGASKAPFLGAAYWFSLISWVMVYPSLVLILLLFPDGRLIGRFWRRLAVFVIFLTVLLIQAAFVLAWPSRNMLIFMETEKIPYAPAVTLLNQMSDVWNYLMIACLLLALISFIIRFLNSQGIERQQLKWFVFGFSTIPASIVLSEGLRMVELPFLEGVNNILYIVAILALPTVMLIAITRYRMYDIDFIIRRTLLYTTLTIALAMIYFGAVLLMQALFSRSFGEQSEIGVVFSTLLIAALFQPLRRSFQAVIDRRFYRRKYDAEETLAHFAAHLQNEVDLDQIQGYLVRAVEENIQPEQSALWLVKR